MAKATIHKFHVEPVQIDIPDECPGIFAHTGERCGSALREPGALQVWQYNDARCPAKLPAADDGDKFTVEDGVALDFDHGSQSGESWSPTVAIYCFSCGHCFGEGGFMDLPPAEAGRASAGDRGRLDPRRRRLVR